MYLFDTDIISNIFKKHPSPVLLKRLTGLAKSSQFISVITVAEIVYGARKSRQPEHHLRNLTEILLPEVNVLDFDLKAAYLAGELRADLERRGEVLAAADIEIAAIALANDMILVTGNTRHFSRIPRLIVENWLTG